MLGASLAAPWGLDFPAAPTARFHFVAEEAWLLARPRPASGSSFAPVMPSCCHAAARIAWRAHRDLPEPRFARQECRRIRDNVFDLASSGEGPGAPCVFHGAMTFNIDDHAPSATDDAGRDAGHTS